MQKNKLYLLHPPAQKKNKMKLPPLLNNNFNKNVHKSFDDSLIENQNNQPLLELTKKSSNKA